MVRVHWRVFILLSDHSIILFFLPSDWGGYVSESSMPFILLVGSFRPEQVTDILDGFLNTVSKDNLKMSIS